LSYVATASRGFAARHFPDGVTKERLAEAPTLRFDRRDNLQLRWARESFGATELAAPHYAPTTQAFVDLALLGVGWTMNPIQLAQAHLSAGRLVDLSPGRRLDVALYWQHARLGSSLLERLTREATAVARKSLQPLA
jgi:LysR family transcriptional regulator (chromosome initiation inhibitor)